MDPPMDSPRVRRRSAIANDDGQRNASTASPRTSYQSHCLRQEPYILNLPLSYSRLFLRTAQTFLITILTFLRVSAVSIVATPTLRPAELSAISIVLLVVHFFHKSVLASTLQSVISPDVLRELMAHSSAMHIGPEAMAGGGPVSTILGAAGASTARPPSVPPLQSQAQIHVAVVGLVSLGAAAAVILILSVHLWLHLLGHLASRNQSGSGPSPLATAGVVAFLVTQSLFPALLVLNGAYACWAAGDTLLCGGAVTATLWACITVVLYRSATGGVDP